MSKKENIILTDVVSDYMYDLAKTICKEYCKYGEQYKIDQEKYDDENPTYLNICTKCPLIDYYT